MQKGSVVRGTVRAVSVSVRELVGIGRPNADDFDVKSQIHARERVIRVEQNVIGFDAHHGHDWRELVFARLKLISDRQFAIDWNRGPRHALDLRVIAFTVGLSRRDMNHPLCACGKTEELLLETVDNLARALEKTDRLTAD